MDEKYEIDPNGCWLWRGSLRKGYGRIKVKGITYQAHRYVYEGEVGPIPEGLELDHLCRVRHCVNPEHLEPVSRQENHLRGMGRFNKQGQTHCKRGHDLNDAYVYNGSRHCRECAINRSKAAHAARKA